MADAEFTFKATGAETVVSANKKIEQSMQAQAKASGKSGYAVLEASRALEDFSMAGMRGALNNIPQLLLNLGVGAGLTGVLGALTVVVWKGVDAIGAYISSLHDAMEASARVGAGLFNEDEITASFSEEAIKRAKEMTLVLQDMASELKFLDQMYDNSTEENASRESLRQAEEMLDLTKREATEEQKAAAALAYKISLLNKEREILTDKSDRAASEVDKVKELIKAQEKIIAQKVDIDAINKSVIKEFTTQVPKQEGKSNEAILKKAGTVKGMMGLSFDAVKGMLTGGEDIKRNLDVFENAAKAANKYRENQLKSKGLTEKELTESVQNAELARKKIEILQKEQKIKEDILRSSREEAESSGITTSNKIEELEKLDEIRKIEEDRKKKESEDKARMARMLAERAVDVSGFMSDQGRVGLAANEAKNAMDVLSIAKEQLKTLKEIARNTGRNRATVYA